MYMFLVRRNIYDELCSVCPYLLLSNMYLTNQIFTNFFNLEITPIKNIIGSYGIDLDYVMLSIQFL